MVENSSQVTRKRGRPRQHPISSLYHREAQGDVTEHILLADPLLPPALYAEIAPLPVPFAHYALTRLQKQLPHASDTQLQMRFLTALREARETAFEVLDDFVRNRHEPIAPELRLSTEWLLKELAAYDPQRTMPDSTFKNWQKRGLIRMEAWGKPQPSNAAAVLMIRMLDRQKEHIFPFTLAASEPDYWCYVKEYPTSSLDVLPISHVHLLPPSAVIWTPWAGACWGEQERWHLMGENEASLGAIRFAGTKMIRGERWWAVNWPTLTTWEPAIASWYQSFPGHHDRQVETLASLVLERLFLERVPGWMTQIPHMSCRLDAVAQPEKGTRPDGFIS
ncbi:hypothetical protein [Ktedonospora formicarum]|uniref:Uncharacterized protein n=1 Tax=Ktedonospora formicarum TaxID=2778364 RepID=A0A8J3I3M6_9CHLR|nr:hypothetical protein [Ktedonospora formicarum]GHO48704.1 hypothetical protein KSX_68670 [Ktedonospora formicarum]